MGKFVLKKTATGYDFALHASNGETIATSQVYASKDSCKKGIESIRTNAPEAGVEDRTVENFEEVKHPKFEVFADKSGKIRFHLKAKNGEIIAVSQGYKEKSGAMKGIDSVRRNADAPVEEETE